MGCRIFSVWWGQLHGIAYFSSAFKDTPLQSSFGVNMDYNMLWEHEYRPYTAMLWQYKKHNNTKTYKPYSKAQVWLCVSVHTCVCVHACVRARLCVCVYVGSWSIVHYYMSASQSDLVHTTWVSCTFSLKCEAYNYALQTVWYNAAAVFDVHLKSP